MFFEASGRSQTLKILLKRCTVVQKRGSHLFAKNCTFSKKWTNNDPPGTPKTFKNTENMEKCCLNLEGVFWSIFSSNRQKVGGRGGAQRRGGRLRLAAMQSIGLRYLARPATSDRGAADLKASPLPPTPFDSCWLAGCWLAGLQLAGWLAGWLAFWLACSLACWLAGWLVCCFAVFP